MPVQFGRLGFEHGLSHGIVHDIVQDRRGFMWFATEDGVNRYDGHAIKVYQPIKGNARSLVHENVKALHVDRNGVLWVGTHEGLCRYNELTDDFTPLLQGQTDSAGLSVTKITDLWDDASGTLWIATDGNGLIGYTHASGATSAGSTARVRWYKHEPNNPLSIPSNQIWKICPGRDGALWLGLQDKGVVEFHPQTGIRQHIVIDKVLAHIKPQSATLSSESKKQVKALSKALSKALPNDAFNTIASVGFSPNASFGVPFVSPVRRVTADLRAARQAPGRETVWGLHLDQRGVIWIGTWGAGLISLNTVTKDATLYYFGSQETSSLSLNSVLSLHEDKLGMMWVGTRGGVVLLNPATSMYQHFQNIPSDPTTLAHNIVWSITEDRTGSVWFATEHCISTYNRLNQRFRTLRHDPYRQGTLSSNNIHTLHEDREGRLWVGTWGGGLNMYDPAVNRFVTYTHEEYNPNSLSQNSIWSVTQDSEGMIWVGTTSGLNRFDPKRQLWTRFFHNPADTNSPAHDYIKTLCWDASHNVLWVGTTQRGISGYYPNRPLRKRWIHFRHEPSNPHSISSNNVSVLYVDNNQTLWAGTYGKGLNRYNSATNTWTRFTADATNSHALPDSVITSLQQDARGVLWVGTMKGLCSFDAATGHFTRYEGNGWSRAERICGILCEANGNLWISTQRGIVRFHPSSQTLQRFTVEDGLQDNKFNNRACTQLQTGALVFGGVNGLSVFHPDSLALNYNLPPVVLTGLKCNGVAVQLDTNIVAKRWLEFQHSDIAVALDFAALDYTNPRNNQYAYILEGFDKNWIYIGSQHTAYYTNLPAGRYTLKVRASNNDGIWNNESLNVSVVMRPPLWRTWWAYGLYALGAALILETVLKLHQRRQRQRFLFEQQQREAELIRQKNEELAQANAALQKLNTEKNEIMSIVAHDMKNPISAVVLQTEILKEVAQEIDKPELAGTINEVASGILRISYRMLDMVKNLLDMNAFDEGKIMLTMARIDVANICRSLIKIHSYTAAQKGITLFYASDAVVKDYSSHTRQALETEGQSALSATEHSALFDATSDALSLPETQDHPIYITADVRATTQIVENLLTNAIKYSPVGKRVWIEVLTTPERITCLQEQATMPLNQRCVLLVVRDEGPGISDKDKERLFVRFSKLSARPTAGEHSTGLGLAIVKRFVDAMNGAIWCDSVEGKGATFVVQFPASIDSTVSLYQQTTPHAEHH
jgi:signal transduction histidine kinase/ligand-binding sensor domain-containing protein